MSLDNNNPQEIVAKVKKILFLEGYELIDPDQPPTTPQEEITIAYLLKKLEEEEQATYGFRDALERVQKLADEVQMRNSHLQVENDVLRRENTRLRSAQSLGQQQPAGETALDYPPTRRRWTFGLGVKKIRVIGGEGQ